MLPVLQISLADGAQSQSDLDVLLSPAVAVSQAAETVLDAVLAVASGVRKPKLWLKNVDFQITRGYLGISM